ncbi:Metabotropic GABA-B receptor subtype 2, isoform C [Chytridiales sp. JEL 0842]|nr:Metabotropic GABA-B receptor subtype 2, isoform C [Chytridiales sp. JEL 0842]
MAAEPQPHYWMSLLFFLVLNHGPRVVSSQDPDTATKTNITLALFFPYAIDDLDPADPDYPSLTRGIMAMDAAARLAIEEINRDSSILPGIQVNFQRYNSWDPEFSYDYDVIDSGGYAAIAALEAAENPDGPNHVWMGYNAPEPLEGTMDEIYGAAALEDIIGFLQSDGYPMDDEGASLPGFVPETFDCVKTMLYGFDKLLRDNSSITPSMLPSLLRSQRMTADQFSNTGYAGALYNPIQLNEYGDINLPYIYVDLQTTKPYAFDYDLAFAMSNIEATNLTYFRRPNLNGNISVFPPDGRSEPEELVTFNSSSGKLILTLCIVGYLLALASATFIITFRQQRHVRAASPPFCLIIILGTVCAFTSSLLNGLEPLSTMMCEAQQYLELLAYVLVYGAIMIKTYRIHFLFTRKTMGKSIFTSIYPSLGALLVLVAIEMALLILRSRFLRPTPRYNALLAFKSFYPTLPARAFTPHPSTCLLFPHSPLAFQTISISLYTYNILLLLTTFHVAYLTRNVSPGFNDSILTILLVVSTFALGVSVVPALVTGADWSHARWVVTRSVAVWGLGVFVLGLGVGSKVVEVYWYYKARNNSRNSLASVRMWMAGKAGVDSGVRKGDTRSASRFYLLQVFKGDYLWYDTMVKMEVWTFDGGTNRVGTK